MAPLLVSNLCLPTHYAKVCEIVWSSIPHHFRLIFRNINVNIKGFFVHLNPLDFLSPSHHPLHDPFALHYYVWGQVVLGYSYT